MLLHVVATVLVAIVSEKVFGNENFDKSHQLTTNHFKKKKKEKNLENLLIISQIIKQTNKNKLFCNSYVYINLKWAVIKANCFYLDKLHFILCAAFKANIQLCITKYSD